MSQADPELDDDLLAEYDFSEAVQGKHYKEYREGTEVILNPSASQEEPPAP